MNMIFVKTAVNVIVYVAEFVKKTAIFVVVAGDVDIKTENVNVKKQKTKFQLLQDRVISLENEVKLLKEMIQNKT